MAGPSHINCESSRHFPRNGGIAEYQSLFNFVPKGTDRAGRDRFRDPPSCSMGVSRLGTGPPPAEWRFEVRHSLWRVCSVFDRRLLHVRKTGTQEVWDGVEFGDTKHFHHSICRTHLWPCEAEVRRASGGSRTSDLYHRGVASCWRSCLVGWRRSVGNGAIGVIPVEGNARSVVPTPFCKYRMTWINARVRIHRYLCIM